MKTNLTPEQLAAITEAVRATGARLYTNESSDPTCNAQRNLSGRTHYVDADTLKWHKSRVLSTAILEGGLLFRITESCALDMHNTSRGFRCVVFDVFGFTVERPALNATFRTSDQARNACAKVEIDLVAHYQEAIKSKLYWAEQDAAKLRAAQSAISAPATVAA